MNEQDVWKWANKIWAKRKKLETWNGISIIPLETGDWLIDISDHTFLYEHQVEGFLDGLEG